MNDFGELNALAADLRKVGPRAQMKARQVVRKAAHDVEASAKRRAPVDTGTLRNSISTSSTGPFSAEVGPTVAYGVYLEHGTSKMAPRPYMSPALDEVTPAFVAAIEQLGGEMLS